MMVYNSILYDRRGIPILPGDTLKVFHFIAAQRREKRYMYKFVESIEKVDESKPALLKIRHLNLENGWYWQLMNGRVLSNYEIVQGYSGVSSGCDFRDRPRFKYNKERID